MLFVLFECISNGKLHDCRLSPLESMCSAHQPHPALQFVVEDETTHVKWYKNHRFWTVVASILVTELLLIAGLIMVIRFKHYKVIWFEWWRWLFFFSGQKALCMS